MHFFYKCLAYFPVIPVIRESQKSQSIILSKFDTTQNGI